MYDYKWNNYEAGKKEKKKSKIRKKKEEDRLNQA
jgi:hypothetical protein